MKRVKVKMSDVVRYDFGKEDMLSASSRKIIDRADIASRACAYVLAKLGYFESTSEWIDYEYDVVQDGQTESLSLRNLFDDKWRAIKVGGVSSDDYVRKILTKYIGGMDKLKAMYDISDGRDVVLLPKWNTWVWEGDYASLCKYFEISVLLEIC